MKFIFNILWNTPWWVWVVLAVLLSTGIEAMKTRTVVLWRPLIVPVFFIGWIVGAAAPMQLVRTS
jgi:teichoic acid transport system permease protein